MSYAHDAPVVHKTFARRFRDRPKFVFLRQEHSVDTLKIDCSFVRDVANDRIDQALAKTIITLAHSLGMRVAGEGVETAEQPDMLRAFGADCCQGILLLDRSQQRYSIASLRRIGRAYRHSRVSLARRFAMTVF